MVAPLRLVPVLLCLLSSCAGGGGPQVVVDRDPRYPGLSCAPFARELTGITLIGNAGDWWREAGGRYERVRSPEVGSVLVFRATGRLPSGHVAVVSRVRGPRQVDVIQANWVPGELERDQLVVDVSAPNDWSLVRVWYPPVGQLGSRAYPTYGFILPRAPLSHDALAEAAAPAAARTLMAR